MAWYASAVVDEVDGRRQHVGIRGTPHLPLALTQRCSQRARCSHHTPWSGHTISLLTTHSSYTRPASTPLSQPFSVVSMLPLTASLVMASDVLYDHDALLLCLTSKLMSSLLYNRKLLSRCCLDRAALLKYKLRYTTLEIGAGDCADILSGRVSLPLSLTSVVWSCCEQLVPGALPSTVHELIFDTSFNRLTYLPPELTSLTLGEEFDQAIAPGQLPNGLLSLSSKARFDQPLLPGVLPSSLTSLVLNWHTEQLLPTVLPSSLVEFKIQTGYNHPVVPGALPPSLTTLNLGRNFDQPIAIGVLPASLTSLSLGTNYGHALLPGVLPASLLSFVFGSEYNHPLHAGDGGGRTDDAHQRDQLVELLGGVGASPA